ncbi:MAG: threonine/serine dehydratase [Gemmatimonadaceae bacterium]|nr:threonine/serine dehydratase [Gemmatimonadaceae bacterium]NUO95828.1 threonine/serine dehydratase [Gemmatimonadaceae bacterium]NUP70156.1 threonine/serine dehydratase [Gemmatimonadaceae bacterium]NUS34543.1 threonine/serine dehydratase [Gemmatimonadaceae bacterium]NUS46847.1 threonine/serine dehydratase [Gemmatimonadaceae bacterium]
MPELITLDDLTAAAARIAPVAVRTPLLPFDTASEQLGAEIWLKPEMLQRGGAFKFRGAYNFLARLSPAERSRGVIAPSSGNHAQAVALAARLFGVKAVVVMPTTVTPAKRGGAERLGARIELAGTTTQDRMDRAVELMEAEGLTMVPPYDHEWIIAGQGTAGLEIVDALPDVETVLVPVGGGGLSAGVATAIKLRAPRARVIGVEPAGAPKLSRAREAGQPVRIPSSAGLADGLLAVEVGGITFAHHEKFVDEVVQVDDAALGRAMRLLLDRMKVVAEPSGAITVAALMERVARPRGKTVALLSGGNIEWGGLAPLVADV